VTVAADEGLCVHTNRNFGDAVAHSFGLTSSPTVVSKPLRSTKLSVSRLSIGADQLGMSKRIPAENTFVLALYLTDLPYHELWSEGRAFISQGYKAGSIRIVNLEREFSANVFHPHESMAFYIPRAALDEFAVEHDLPRVRDIVCEPGTRDPVLECLAGALQPVLQNQTNNDALLVDYIALALCARLTSAYGRAESKPAKGALSAAQVRRATEYMVEKCDDDISLADIAAECGLSRGYFAQAFKLAVGVAPHQWLRQYRIEKAKGLLRSTRLSIAQIAVSSGFADQSHLTRVFTQSTGDGPAAWRRRFRN
jgi:AraC family transcriptional regulator